MRYTTRDRPDIEKMLEMTNEWLNAHAEINHEQEWTAVTRDQYNEYDDHPVIILDEEFTEFFEMRLVRISATPFHDEGGPASITGIFTKYLTDEWELQNLYYEFDTYGDVIVSSGKFEDPRKNSATS